MSEIIKTESKELLGTKYPAKYSHTTKDGIDKYVYRGHIIYEDWVRKCESDETYYKCIVRDGIKKITRAHWYYDKYLLEDGKIRLESRIDESDILEGYEFIGCDDEPYLIVTYDTRGIYVKHD